MRRKGDKNKKQNVSMYEEESTRTTQKGQTERSMGLQLLPWLEDYTKNQLADQLGKQTEKVHERLQLQNGAIKIAKQRESNSDFYLQYNYNPFLGTNPKYLKQIKQISKNNQTKLTNLVDLLSPSQRKSFFPLRQNIIQKQLDLKNKKVENQLRSKKISAAIAKKMKIQFNKTNKLQQLEIKKYEQRESQVKKQPQLFEMDIQVIAMHKQKNFFMENNKINIFKVVRGEEECLTSLDFLRRKNFSFNSMIEKNFKFRLPIYRDLSVLGREVSTNTYKGKQRIIDYIFSDQLIFNDCGIQDVLSLASYRITPDILEKMIFSIDIQQKNSDLSSSSQTESETIVFKRNQISKQNNYIGENQQAEQIQTFLKLPYSKIQKQTVTHYEKQKDLIVKTLQYENFLVENTINDKKLSIKLSDKVKQSIRKYLYPEKQKQIEPGALVRQKKRQSKRDLKIKFTSFNKLLNQRNQMSKIKMKMMRRKGKDKQNILFQ